MEWNQWRHASCVCPTAGYGLGKKASAPPFLFSSHKSLSQQVVLPAALSSLRLRHALGRLLISSQRRMTPRTRVLSTWCGGQEDPPWIRTAATHGAGVWVYESLLKKLPFLDSFRMQNYQFPSILRRKPKPTYYGLGVEGGGGCLNSYCNRGPAILACPDLHFFSRLFPTSRPLHLMLPKPGLLFPNMCQFNFYILNDV